MDKRPAGISILTFIYVLVGMLGMMMNPTPISQDWVTYLTYAVLIISAAALFLRHRWAWWVLGTMTAFSIMLNCINSFVILTNLDVLPDASRYAMKAGGKLLIQSLILIYFFSQSSAFLISKRTTGHRSSLCCLELLASFTLFWY